MLERRWRKLGTYWQEIKPVSHTMHKNKLEMDHESNVNILNYRKTTKNRDKFLLDLGTGKVFLSTAHNPDKIKESINKHGDIKINKHLHSRRTVHEVKRQLTHWGKGL